MVQEYKSPIRVYKYPFELVMAAYVRRFPTCDMIPVLISTDILRQEDDGCTQVIERRCKLNVDAPYLLKKMAGVDFFYCIQRNRLDRQNRRLEIQAWNETFSKKIIINEFCSYTVHPDNPSWTCFEQSASLEVKSFFGFETAVEKLAVKHYAQSIQKGKEIIEHYVQLLREEGVDIDWLHDERQDDTDSTRCQSHCSSQNSRNLYTTGDSDSAIASTTGDDNDPSDQHKQDTCDHSSSHEQSQQNFQPHLQYHITSDITQ